MRLAIVTTHPIQYNAPWFRLIAEHKGWQVKVFYTWSQSQEVQYDPGFERKLQWDIPLLTGYEFEFVENISRNPGSHHFFGIRNPSLCKNIAGWHPEAILVIGWSFVSHLQCMYHFKGKVPVIFRGDSTLLNEKPGIKRVLRRYFLRWVYSYVDFALVVGTNNRKYFEVHGLSEAQMIDALHAIDNNRFLHPDNEYRTKASRKRIELGVSESDFVVLYAGKFEEVKNPLFLKEISRYLPGSAYKFIAVGNGPLESELIGSFSDDSRFRLLGFQNQSEMPIVYRMANVLIMPSKSETWGLALNEAMASGVPVIASEHVGGAVDLITSESLGLVFSLDQPASAAKYVEKLRRDREFSTSVSAEVRRHIMRFSFEGIVDALETIKSKLNAGKRF